MQEMHLTLGYHAVRGSDVYFTGISSEALNRLCNMVSSIYSCAGTKQIVKAEEYILSVWFPIGR